MGLHKRMKSIAAGAIAGTMFIAGLSVFPANNGTQDFEVNAASACTINTNKLYQRIRGFGGMNHPEWQSYNVQNGAPGDIFCVYLSATTKTRGRMLSRQHKELQSSMLRYLRHRGIHRHQ